jgi:hypothetical protein
MSIDTFRTTPRLDGDDLQRLWHHGAETFRLGLRRHHTLAGLITVKRLGGSQLKLSWSVERGTATESQVVEVHRRIRFSLQCPECKQFRKRLFFTSYDDCPFDTNWFHCERCVDRRLEPGKRARRPKTPRRDRRATRALHRAVASEPVDPYGTSFKQAGGPANN